MKKRSFFRPALCLALFAIFQSAAIFAQQKVVEPELSVIGIKLGDRASAKAFLSGYAPRRDEERPAYYFYNGYGSQVMKLTAASVEDPYFITEIEVFKINDSYQKKHYQTKEHNLFVTEKGIFIGFRQSLTALFTVPGASRNDMIGPNDVVRKKGEPTMRVKEGSAEVVKYNIEKIELPDDQNAGKTKAFRYAAQYEFYKNKLVKFDLKLLPTAETEIAAAK